VNQTQRSAFVANIKDPSLRKVAEEHPDCLHPCVWLVKDKDGPLEAGGKPQRLWGGNGRGRMASC